MATRKIVTIEEDESFLRKHSKKVEVFDDKLGELLDDMASTLKVSEGVGLAAPQIGLLKNLFIVCLDGENFFEFVNPKITKTSGKVEDKEGCLSVPKVAGTVVRPKKLTIEFQDRFGANKKMVAEDYFARVICHEYDHLCGILFIDKMKI